MHVRSLTLRPLATVAFFLLVLSPWRAAGQQMEETPAVHPTDDPILAPFRWRSIGPAGQGGRVDDIAAVRGDPRTFFVGFATGGLWKTTNQGVTFHPVFDTHGAHSVGDVAIAPSDPSRVYVGTGESNNRQSSSFGGGMYRSDDGGETFTNVGLDATQSIARVLVHPTNPDVVWVAANGHLFGPNPERGVFKSSDGGRSWTKVLYVDENTGATDLVMSPDDPDVLFAATYQRRRTACCFVGGGPGSGLWRSDDGGDTWSPVSGNGLPEGTMGRISLAVTPAAPAMVYAQIELAADQAEPLSDAEREEWERLDDADSLPPDPHYSGIWRSDDGGATWEFRGNENGRPMYFSQMRISPSDPDLVYVVDQNVHKSRDGGVTFEQLEGYGHVDQHAFWVDPDDHDHLMIGNDGSVDVSWDQGENWESLRSWAVGQPYHASVDMRRPYYVCTGLQDNGSWCGPSSVRSGPILAQDWYRVGGGDGFYSAVDPTDYTVVYAESQNGNVRRLNLRTGESQSIRPSPPDEDDPETNIVPAPPAGTQVRWNWNTPFMLSPHNASTIYVGGNHLFRSTDRGETWTMSPDLTKDVDRDAVEIMGYPNSLPRCDQDVRGTRCILSRNDGVSRYSTITTISESPIVPGLLWVGTDDGNIEVSRDGGATWAEVGANVPGGTRQYYVSRVEASHVDPGTAYASLDGHRSDDLTPFVFVTRDYGRSWTSLASDLPATGNVHTVRQDPRNPRLLYLGTEFGFFVSRDEGGRWQRFMPGLPTVRVDDVLVHPRDDDLVLATHGRSVWIMDDVTALQELTDSVQSAGTHLFHPRDAVLWNNDITQSRSVTGNKNWEGENAPEGTAIHYYLARAASGDVSLTVSDPITGEVFRHLDASGRAGLNRVRWDLRGDPPQQGQGQGGGGFGRNRAPTADPGIYRVTLSVNGRELSTTVTVLEDRWMGIR